MNLSEMSGVFGAIALAERRGATREDLIAAIDAIHKDVPPKEVPKQYFCNKCGYFGPTSEHLRANTLKPCHYLAV